MKKQKYIVQIWTNEYARIFMDIKRSKRTSEYFREWNRWEISWRDISELKIFTPLDLYYITQTKKDIITKQNKKWT